MRFLVVSKSVTPEVESIVTAAQAFPDVDVVVADVETDAFDFSPYDAVYWRSATVTKSFAKQAGRQTLLRKNRQKTHFFNGFLVNNPQFVLKSVQQAHLEVVQDTIKTIPTYLARDRAQFEQLVQTGELTFPCIAKPNQGSQGNGVILLETVEQIADVTDCGAYVFQNYIPNSADYRVMVVGGVAVDVIMRSATDASEKQYLNNVSQGGVASAVPAGALRDTLLHTAARIATAFNYEVCGIDLIVHAETDDVYFMEINSVPQWELFRPALTYDVGRAIVQLAHDYTQRSVRSIGVNIRSYYDRHITELSTVKRFHYLSRTALLMRDKSAVRALQAMRDEWLPDRAVLIDRARSIPTAVPPRTFSGKQYRKQYTQHHWKVSAYNAIFFKILFLQTVYQEDVHDLLSAVDTADLRGVIDALWADREALFALSTGAINFLYHARNFFPEVCAFEPEAFLDLAHEYEGRFSWSLDAKIYLYTHAVIGASRFYATPIESKHDAYVRMLRELEHDVFMHYSKVSLDQKCEILVCARLLGATSSLYEPVLEEAAASLSPLGNYIIDVFNSHRDIKRSVKQSFEGSEHRNVLAIAAFSEID